MLSRVFKKILSVLESILQSLNVIIKQNEIKNKKNNEQEKTPDTQIKDSGNYIKSKPKPKDKIDPAQIKMEFDDTETDTDELLKTTIEPLVLKNQDEDKNVQIVNEVPDSNEDDLINFPETVSQPDGLRHKRYGWKKNSNYGSVIAIGDNFIELVKRLIQEKDLLEERYHITLPIKYDQHNNTVTIMYNYSTDENGKLTGNPVFEVGAMRLPKEKDPSRHIEKFTFALVKPFNIFPEESIIENNGVQETKKFSSKSECNMRYEVRKYMMDILGDNYRFRDASVMSLPYYINTVFNISMPCKSRLLPYKIKISFNTGVCKIYIYEKGDYYCIGDFIMKM